MLQESECISYDNGTASERSSVDEITKRCKECLQDLPLDRFRVHQNYCKPKDFGRSSRCKQCVRERAERKKLEWAMLNAALEQPRYHWDGYTARCNRCSGMLYFDGEDVKCRACGEQITTARQPVPLVLTRLRLLKEQAVS